MVVMSLPLLRRASILAALLLVGCRGTRPIPTDSPVVLEPDEGILVLHVETNTGIKYLRLNRLRIMRNLGRGSHLRLVTVAAGEYAWTRLQTSNGYRVSLRESGDMAFRVLPGRINYPGQLIIYDHGRQVGINVRAINRSGMVSSALEVEFPRLVQERGLVYVGPGLRDEFFDRHRHALGSSNTPMPDAP